MVVMVEAMAITAATMGTMAVDLTFFFSVTATAVGAMTFKIIANAAQRAVERCIPAADMAAVVVGALAAVTAVAEEDIERVHVCRASKPDYLMKFSNQKTRFSSIVTVSLLAMLSAIYPARVLAAGSNTTQESFPSSDAAISALQSAVATNDNAALNKLFGPEFSELMTGDKVQDANNLKKFAADIAQRCQPVKDRDDKITLEIGSNEWPMPIPLVRVDGQWHFDTPAGKEEIINRHIGKDELTAIGVCRAYVTAQQHYASENPSAAPGTTYARHFKSSPGKKDGLYWAVSGNQTISPFGPLVAEAETEGYVIHKKGTGPHPYHGYYFRILTQQGDAARGGKMSYLSDGSLTNGFALVAYPEHWDQSGVMTFIVNQDGKVFQCNLGENTSSVAAAMKDYNPDSTWALVQDEGVSGVDSQK